MVIKSIKEMSYSSAELVLIFGESFTTQHDGECIWKDE